MTPRGHGSFTEPGFRFSLLVDGEAAAADLFYQVSLICLSFTVNTIALAGFFFFKTLLRLTDYGSSRREYSITEPFVSKTVYLNRK